MRKKLLLNFILCFVFSLSLTALSQKPENSNQFIIESISIEENKKTRSGVFFENLPYAIGDTLTEQEIHAGIDNLRNLQFFNKVTLRPHAGSEPGRLKLNIKVKERYWPSLRFKGGFSELSGWYITPLSINFDNIFGLGNYTDLNLTIGDRVSSLNFNYINPNIFDSDLDFYFRFILRGQEFLNYINEEKFIHKVSQAGYFLGFRSRQPFFKRFLFGFNYYTTAPDSFITGYDSGEKYFELPAKIAQYSNDSYETSAFSVYFDLDKRDQPYYPTRGWWIGTWFTQASMKQEQRTNFTRLIIDVRKYQRLVKNLVIAGRLKLGGISAIAPFYEKFYLGGPNSLRGYDDRSLSPVGGGERFFQGGLELRFPLTTKKFPEHFLTGVIFFDSGANLLEAENINSNNIKNGYGFGLRFKLPFIGLFRVDFAYPMRGGDGLIQFSLGHTF